MSTAGKNISMKEMRDFIETLEINQKDKENLLKLEPENYIGLASKIVEIEVNK